MLPLRFEKNFGKLQSILLIVYNFFSVMVMAWTGGHCAFAVETFFKRGESIIEETESFLCSFHVMSE